MLFKLTRGAVYLHPLPRVVFCGAPWVDLRRGAAVAAAAASSAAASGVRPSAGGWRPASTASPPPPVLRVTNTPTVGSLAPRAAARNTVNERR